jgi:hypothetical protein
MVQFGDRENEGHVLERGVVRELEQIRIIVALTPGDCLVELVCSPGKNRYNCKYYNKDEDCPKPEGGEGHVQEFSLVI